MNYSEEEIKFVEFCVKEIDSSKAECPLSESCEERKEICSTIPKKMRKGEELSPDEKKVVQYFAQGAHWDNYTECKPSKEGPKCPNLPLCTEEDICRELVRRLGLDLPKEDEISEKEDEILENKLHKIFLKNMPNIDWKFGEQVECYAHEYETPTVGRVDFLLKGKEKNILYVVEIKSGMADHRAVGQLMSYLGWFKENLSKEFPTMRGVKGILVAREFEPKAKSAISAGPDIEARIFKLSVSIEEI